MREADMALAQLHARNHAEADDVFPRSGSITGRARRAPLSRKSRSFRSLSSLTSVAPADIGACRFRRRARREEWLAYKRCRATCRASTERIGRCPGKRGRRPVGRGRRRPRPVGKRRRPRLNPPISRTCCAVGRISRKILPGGTGSGAADGLGARRGHRVVLWLASGFYRVEPDEEGIVLRFGAYDRHDRSRAQLSSAVADRRGADADGDARQSHRDRLSRRRHGGRSGRVTDVPEESLMLTGDENIVDINFTVFWLVKDAPGLSVQHPRSRDDGEVGRRKRDARGDRPAPRSQRAGRRPRQDRDRYREAAPGHSR